jgi:hypothetical protein
MSSQRRRRTKDQDRAPDWYRLLGWRIEDGMGMFIIFHG